MADYDYKAGKQRLEEILTTIWKLWNKTNFQMMMILRLQMVIIVG